MNSVQDLARSETDAARTVLQHLLQKRQSCRAFQDRAVPRETIENIVEMAQLTASWCNAQPWKLHIASAQATERIRERFYNHAISTPPSTDLEFPRKYEGLYQERRLECALQLYGALDIRKGDREGSARQAAENFRFFGAPHFAIITTERELGVYGALDCGAFVSNFMLAATSHGVATIAQAALAAQSDFWRAELDLPEDRLVVCGISFGYADADHPANSFRTTRAPLDEVISWVD